MARSFRPGLWFFFTLVFGIVSLTTGFTGCGSVSGNPPPAPSPSPVASPTPVAQDACAVPAAPTSFKEQFLIAGDVLESNTFFVYKLDQQTGVPTAMPWSPMLLDGFVMSEAPDAAGNYIYLGVRTGLDSANLETFSFPADGSAPVHLDSQPLKADQLAFDPQQHFLYVLRQGFVNSSLDQNIPSTLSVFQIGSDHIPLNTNQTLDLVDRAASFGFKDQGRAMVVSREHITSGNTSIAVLNRDCKTGSLTQASETPILRSLILSVPTAGNGVLAYRLCCDPFALSGAQLSRYDPSTQSVAAVPNGTLPDTFEAAVDRASDFVVTDAAEAPNQPGSIARDLVKVYRYDPIAITLTQTDQYQFLPISPGVPEIPTDITFDLNDNFVYVSIHNAIAVFRLDHTTGKITPIPGSPFPAPTLLDPVFVFGR
jgi:hypothetical protein